MHATPLNIAAVITFLLLLPDLLAVSVKWCRKALANWLTRK
jgi:hypothetical protein